MNQPVFLLVSASIDDEELAARTMESLARVVAGLAMEGVTVTITIGPEELEETED